MVMPPWRRATKHFYNRLYFNPSTFTHVRNNDSAAIYLLISTLFIQLSGRLHQKQDIVCVSHFIQSSAIIMSRSHRRPSEYSRGSSPRIDRTLSVTEASFQNLGLNETAGAHHLSIPSAYETPSQRHRRPSGLRSELSSNYLPSEYDTTSFYRTASPVPFDLQPPSTYDTSILDEEYPLFPEVSTISTRGSPFSSTISRTAMGYSHVCDVPRPRLTSLKQLSLPIRYNVDLPRAKLLCCISVPFPTR